MIDPIDRVAALDAICRDGVRLERSGVLIIAMGKAKQWAADLIAGLPSAEKRGKWERHWSRPGVYADLFWHCTACGGKTDMQFAHVVYKFCPFCGATMERGADE